MSSTEPVAPASPVTPTRAICGRLATRVVALLLLVLVASAHAWRDEPGAGALMLWPSARSIALAGAMTGLADEADATYYNPAGLTLRNSTCLNLNYGHWLPGLYSGMSYANGSFATPLRRRLGPFRNLSVGANITWLALRETEVINEHGEYLGRRLVWRGAAGITASAVVGPNLGVGLGLKVFHSQHTFAHYWWTFELPYSNYPRNSYDGLEYGGDATTIAADLGLLWRVGERLRLGASLVNLGPSISYSGDYEYLYAAPQPTMLRLGLSWTPVQTKLLRLTILPELTKVMSGVGRPYSPQPWRIQDELNDTWKSLGIEVSVLDIVSLRAGYFENIFDDRGGIKVENKDHSTDHVSLLEFITSRNRGTFKQIGVCWGFGVGYQDLLRLDVSNDGAIYDWPESNWRFSLVSDDPAALFARLRHIVG